MAEFIEVARAKRRMCNAHKKKCSECKLQENCSLLNVCAYNDNEVKKFENEIMLWAAEHPEPIYPTWYDYLHSMGIFYKKHTTSGDVSKIHWGNMMTPIPPNIAQKLGIEPKEG